MRTHTILVLFPLLARSVLAATATSCYQLLDSETTPQHAPSDWYPCGTVTSDSNPLACCSNGDTCLGENICLNHYGPSGGESGYYLAGCTDSTWANSASCTKHCNSDAYPDVTYSNTTNEWLCCGMTNGKPDCNKLNSLNEAFTGSAPSALAGTIVAVSPVPATSSPTSTGSPTPTNSPPPPDPPSTGLGAGAQAGIGVGVAAVVVAVILGILLLVWRRRQSKRRGAMELSSYNEPNGGGFHQDAGYQHVDGYKPGAEYPKGGYDGKTNPLTELASPVRGYDGKMNPLTELASSVRPAEMGADGQVYEMLGSDSRHELRG